MNSMAIATKPDPRSGPHGCQWVAVQSLRRLARPRGAGDGGHAVLSSAEARAEAGFQAFLAAVPQVPGVCAPNLGKPGRADPTKDERRLLRALAAAQAGNWPVLDNYLYKFALDQRQRAGLADAVRALATALATSGFVLPAPAQPPIPAPALRVALMHGLALDEFDVAWPGAPQP